MEEDGEVDVNKAFIRPSDNNEEEDDDEEMAAEANGHPIFDRDF